MKRTGFIKMKRTGMNCHGVIQSQYTSWRTRANNRPKVVNRDVRIDTSKCI